MGPKGRDETTKGRDWSGSAAASGTMTTKLYYWGKMEKFSGRGYPIALALEHAGEVRGARGDSGQRHFLRGPRRDVLQRSLDVPAAHDHGRARRQARTRRRDGSREAREQAAPPGLQ